MVRIWHKQDLFATLSSFVLCHVFFLEDKKKIVSPVLTSHYVGRFSLGQHVYHKADLRRRFRNQHLERSEALGVSFSVDEKLIKFIFAIHQVITLWLLFRVIWQNVQNTMIKKTLPSVCVHTCTCECALNCVCECIYVYVCIRRKIRSRNRPSHWGEF